ncbi:tRNA (guanine-N(2)-)-methyltransferase [Microcystis aeruginosa NIES-3806]|uniref:tRNA (guanine-N1)-methyltransferase n=1 Tax=Microcystis aeruginosa TaxID=1126 RepID=UPI00130A57A5|nr:tRNA (guanine-N1)-methyltransferase [Microcystis aeruginosa]GCL55901.1 tRNA (guanine-N(2)-)-methyltransferase [Microcystis aeruginosa NIES-3806]
MQEEKAIFNINNTFYRPESKIVRDLGVLGAAIAQKERGSLRVLEVMSGSGVRALRYWLESGADWLWVNDGNPEIKPTLAANLESLLQQKQGKITYKSAQEVLLECYLEKDHYDLVDIDAFGSPASLFSAIPLATKIGGLIYLTNTDGRTLTGHNLENSLADYGASARNHPAAHEQGLRLIIAGLQLESARLGLGITPIFSFFFGQSYRVMVRLTANRQLNTHNYGFLGYCHSCGEYQSVPWPKLGKIVCSGDGQPLTLTGPLWLGSLHDRFYLEKMADLADQWQWKKVVKLLEIMREENDFPPYFYSFREIGRRGKLDLPKREDLIAALLEQGYRAAATHINPQAVKTNASLAQCIAILKD